MAKGIKQAFSISSVKFFNTDRGFIGEYLKPGEKLVAVFKTNEEVVSAKEYCCLYGLWKTK